MIKAYKGFNKDLRCRDYQFEIGKTFEEDEADLCNKGFHACENPMDVFGYYNPADSRYCEVALDEETDQTEGDSKRCGKKIKIETEIGLKGIIEAGVKFIMAKVDWRNNKESNTGNHSASTNTGNQSAATNAGYHSAATNTGYHSVATNTGNQSAATNTGNHSAATNTGDKSAALNTGNFSSVSVKGSGSIGVVTGLNGKAKGSKGCWICIVERDEDMNVIDGMFVEVDGDTIKEDTYYTLKNKTIIEA